MYIEKSNREKTYGRVWKKVAIILVGCVYSFTILSSTARGGEDFLSIYWNRPIPPQNHKIKFLPYPQECGQCHKNQYKDWKESFHNKAVSPGLLGQINHEKDPDFARSCYFCHAPMAEQSEVIFPSPLAGDGQGEGIKTPSFDNRLKLSGVSCVVCHLREGKIYGPPAKSPPPYPSPASGEGKREGGQKAHNGFIEKGFFERAEFCAACHQLDEGYELNGKVIVNTYREWEESIYSKNNITCQKCHMPDRQHLFRGIHDKEMVLRGVRIESVRHEKGVRLIITNSGAGHYFPTYATPLVIVKGFMLDKSGKAIPSSVKKAFIGRKVSLDLSKEIFDTRIPPEKSFEFDYTVNKSYNRGKLVFEVRVYPDEFYNRFYKGLLKNKDGSFNRKEIEKALKITEGSDYILFKEVL
ncbi:MAG: multiheme c-type cytochrome [Deltaproteobacteria bacterium]|nr:multiheme c-type cytochrome [Deltaproteobacteria bacterium]